MNLANENSIVIMESIDRRNSITVALNLFNRRDKFRGNILIVTKKHIDSDPIHSIVYTDHVCIVREIKLSN